MVGGNMKSLLHTSRKLGEMHNPYHYGTKEYTAWQRGHSDGISGKNDNPYGESMKSFKQFFKEEIEYEGALAAGTINSLNKELFKLTQGDEKSADFDEMFKQIAEVLAKFTVTMVDIDGMEFQPRVVINRRETFIDLAKEGMAINNVVLSVKWNEFNDEYALKEVSLQEKK